MLELDNIQKSFPGNFEPTLKNIHLNLEKGDFCIVIGSNGSGKSTLMKTISGEYFLDKGKILINGQDVTKQNRSKFIASVTQDVTKGIIPEMTLLENMVLSQMRNEVGGFKFYKMREAEILTILQSIHLDLEHYINEPLQKLSGGQRQIIATLMAMSSKPKILLLDEHTSALDPKMQNLLMNYTATQIAQQEITTMMITHRLDDAAKYGNRLIMLHEGCIVLNVAGEEKKSFDVETLLALFHKYEDMMLKSSKDKIS